MNFPAGLNLQIPLKKYIATFRSLTLCGLAWTTGTGTVECSTMYKHSELYAIFACLSVENAIRCNVEFEYAHQSALSDCSGPVFLSKSFSFIYKYGSVSSQSHKFCLSRTASVHFIFTLLCPHKVSRPRSNPVRWRRCSKPSQVRPKAFLTPFPSYHHRYRKKLLSSNRTNMPTNQPSTTYPRLSILTRY